MPNYSNYGNNAKHTKIQVYNATVLFVLLFWCWDIASQQDPHLLHPCLHIPAPEDHQGVQWFDLVSNEVLYWRTGQLSTLCTIAQCCVRWLDNLMTTLTVFFTSMTCHLLSKDSLAADHTADVRMSSIKTSSRLIRSKRMFWNSTMTVRSGGTKWLLSDKHIYGMLFISSITISDK